MYNKLPIKRGQYASIEDLSRMLNIGNSSMRTKMKSFDKFHPGYLDEHSCYVGEGRCRCRVYDHLAVVGMLCDMSASRMPFLKAIELLEENDMREEARDLILDVYRTYVNLDLQYLS